MIEIEGLTFGYKKNQPCLKNIDLSIKGPGLYCIIGPNGSGKSTLIKCMNRILTPQNGRIEINGQDISKTSLRWLSDNLAYVPPVLTFPFASSVFDVLINSSSSDKIWSVSDGVLRHAYLSSSLLGITDLLDCDINELSSGQKQKVMIAMGLAKNASTILLDEPTANLDLRHRLFVIELLRELADRLELTIVMVSHDLELAGRYSSQVIVMNDGQIVVKGVPKDVMDEIMIENVFGVKCSVTSHGDNVNIRINSLSVI